MFAMPLGMMYFYPLVGKQKQTEKTRGSSHCTGTGDEGKDWKQIGEVVQ